MNFKETLVDYILHYWFVLFVIPKTNSNPLSRQVPGIFLFQAVTKYLLFKHTKSKAYTGMHNFKNIYEPVR